MHTPVLNQMMVYEYIKNYDYDGHIAACAKEYGKKCALMIEEMEKHFPSSVKFTRPDGGIFILCTMPEGVDTKVVLNDAIAQNVAYVPVIPLWRTLTRRRIYFGLTFLLRRRSQSKRVSKSWAMC